MFKFEKGGGVSSPVTKFAAAGPVTAQQETAALNAALYGPNAPYSQAQIMAGSPTMTVPQMQQANVAAMTPEQQTWYNQQVAAVNAYNNAQQAIGASYTPPTGGCGGQAPTVNQGQLALGTAIQSMNQSQFNPNMPATPTAATTSPVPAPFVAAPTRVNKTVAPIGGTAVQMQPFTPP